jgi:hypothetical protein
MSEAEVSLRLAFWLVREKLVSEDDNNVFVVIDSAQVKAGQVVVFDVPRFLHENHWRKMRSRKGWQGTYRCSGAASRLVIGPASGHGDVACRLQAGCFLRVKARRGPLTTRINSEERRLVLEALGQLLTLAKASKDDLLAVAVPYSPTFARLAAGWREAPLIKSFRINILTVTRDDEVDGLWRSLGTFRREQEATAAQKTLYRHVRRVLFRVTPDFPPVKRMERSGYSAFAKQGMRVSMKWDFGVKSDVISTADLAMTELVEKWTGRGCTRGLLLRIAEDCFDWIPPEDRPVTSSAD